MIFPIKKRINTEMLINETAALYVRQNWYLDKTIIKGCVFLAQKKSGNARKLVCLKVWE